MTNLTAVCCSKKNDIVKNSMYQYSENLESLPFKDYSENFKIIDDESVSVVVPCDDISQKLIDDIKINGYGDIRKLQKYAFSVHRYEFEILFKQNVVDDFQSGIWCLTNTDYYDRETGVLFEGKDYFI